MLLQFACYGSLIIKLKKKKREKKIKLFGVYIIYVLNDKLLFVSLFIMFQAAKYYTPGLGK